MSQLDLGFDAPPAPPRRARRFHARSHVTLAEAKAGERNAETQEDTVLDFFVPGARWTPSDLKAAMDVPWPITSVRRCLSNLTRAGKLRHYPGVRHQGPHGAMESSWGLPE